jgi:hypothetical protein
VPNLSVVPGQTRAATRTLALAVVAFVGGTGPVSSAPPSAPPPPLPKGYVSYRAVSPVVIDGRLDDAAWKNAPWTDDFVDIEGPVKPLPRFRTRVKMLWDDQFFYVAAELDEPHVWGTLKKHDAVIFQDNDFEVFIDPDGDNHGYYEFEINALNTGWDLFLQRPYRDGGPALNSWEIAGLETATQLDGTLNDPSDRDRGWSVELAFPWKALGEFSHKPSPPRDGDQWRVNFSRVEWAHTVGGKAYRKVPGKREDNWVWSPQGVVDMHRPERWGFVQFSTAATGESEFRPDPAQRVRDGLMAVYHAERDYRDKHKQWSLSVNDLAELPLYVVPPQGTLPVIRKAGEGGYEASITLEAAEGHPRQTWTIRQDSRITRNAVPD